MMNHLVSVIIPAYNAETTILKCVNSILAQTYCNIEIIIVDDGSTDDTRLVCQKLSNSEPKVKFIHQKNGGSSSARNTGIQNAQGEFILFVDGDDYIADDMIYKLMERVLEDTVDVVICGITVNYQHQGYAVKTGFDGYRCAYGDKDIRDLIAQSCENGMLYSPCNKLYQKTIIDKFQLFFPLNQEPIEDILFNCEYMKHIHSISVIPNASYVYVKNDTQSNVTKYRKNLWELSSKRSNAIRELFLFWKMDTPECLRWLDSEYIGGKADCISNCFRVGSDLGFRAKKECFQKYVLNDERCRAISAELSEIQLHYDKRILLKIIKLNSAALSIIIYNILFFIRYRFDGIYYLFRKKQQKK